MFSYLQLCQVMRVMYVLLLTAASGRASHVCSLTYSCVRSSESCMFSYLQLRQVVQVMFVLLLTAVSGRASRMFSYL